MRGFGRRLGATCWAADPGPGSHRPPASALPTLDAHFASQGLVRASAATRPELHHSWLCSQSSRWRSGARGPCPPPSCSSPSTPSWVTLLLPPFSGSWHPHPRSPLPDVCLTVALRSLSAFSCSPGEPMRLGGKGKEAGGGGRGEQKSAPGWKRPSSFLFPTQWKADATLKRNTWL